MKKYQILEDNGNELMEVETIDTCENELDFSRNINTILKFRGLWI